MLYCVWGTDRKTVVDQTQHIVFGLRKKRPNAQYYKFEIPHSVGELEEIISATGLFDDKHIIVIDELWKQEDGKMFIIERVEELTSTPHICILFGSTPDIKTKKVLEEKATKVAIFDTQKEERDTFVFTWVEDVVKRDIQKAWIGLHVLKEAGHSPEAVMGALWWQIRSVAVAQTATSAKESGLSPYVYTKAKRLSKDIQISETIKMYMDAYTKLHTSPYPWTYVEKMVLGVYNL